MSVTYQKAPPRRYDTEKARSCANCQRWDGDVRFQWVGWCMKVESPRACDSKCKFFIPRERRRA